MNFTPTWNAIFSKPHSRKVLLLTLSYQWSNPQRPHTAKNNGAKRYATDVGVEVDGIPFWPNITNWPQISYEFSPEEKGAKNAQTTVAIQSESDFADSIYQALHKKLLFGRVDLWSDGLGFSDLIPLISGQVTGIQQDPSGAGFSVSISDAPEGKDANLPNAGDKLTKAEFPNIPDFLDGLLPKQTILGRFLYPRPCHRIDLEGKEFYICEPPLSSPPEDIYIGSEKLDKNLPTVQIGYLATDPTKTKTYSKLVFPEPVSGMNELGNVSCANGVGIYYDNLVEILISDIAHCPISPEGLAKIRTTKFLLSTFANATVTAMGLVKERILPQTDLIPTSRLGQFHVIQLLEPQSPKPASIGSNLIGIDQPTPETTSVESVFNYITVKFNRSFAKERDGYWANATATIDKTIGGKLGGLLTQSEQRYGRRALNIDAGDLTSYDDAYKLGCLFAMACALTHTKYRFIVDLKNFFRFDLNRLVTLTDTHFNLTDERCRVVRRELFPFGGIITFQTEDLPNGLTVDTL